tara:strand:- start:306 stop:1817 length:1512 start_codon:yes stop_codon:yes gene_type:complete
VLFFNLTNGQTINDAITYNLTDLSGSARFTAMAGAFGASGGDLSAISINPASSSVFLVNQFSISSISYENKTNGSFSNNINQYIRPSIGSIPYPTFHFNQLGAVFVFNNNNENENWSRISLSYNYSDKKRYNNSYIIEGNKSNGLDNYFLFYANGLKLSDLDLYEGETISEVYRILGNDIGFGAQQAFLGYQSYLINPVDFNPDNDKYVSNALYDNLSNYMKINTEGYHGVHSINLSGLYKNFIHLGININLHGIKYEKYNRFVEQGFSEKSNVTEVAFDNTLQSDGEGISFQIGLITKINKNIRLGIYYDSPQWIKIKEKYKQEIVVDYIENSSSISEKIKPDVITIYDPYKIQIPSRKNISLAYIFKRGLVSFDYGVKNYGKTLFKETSNKTSNYLNNLNNKISAELRSVNTLRVGGEYIIGLFSIRAGVLNEKSFQKNITLNNVATSWGLGINFKRSAIDIAFIDNKNKNSYKTYPVVLTDNYYVTNNKSQIILTYNLKF